MHIDMMCILLCKKHIDVIYIFRLLRAQKIYASHYCACKKAQEDAPRCANGSLFFVLGFAQTKVNIILHYSCLFFCRFFAPDENFALLNFAQSCVDSPAAKSCTAVASSRCRLCRHHSRKGCEVTGTPTSQNLKVCDALFAPNENFVSLDFARSRANFSVVLLVFFEMRRYAAIYEKRQGISSAAIGNFRFFNCRGLFKYTVRGSAY